MSNPPTNVSDVVVTGQRRDNISDPFPQYQLVSDYYPSTDATINPDDGMGDLQCSLPVHKKIWNADARAAEGVTDFKTYSSGLSIFDREHHAYLRLNGGVMELGNIKVGPVPVPGQNAQVMPDATGIDGSNYMGDLHTHVSGVGLPSQADITGFLNDINTASLAGRSSAELDSIAMYIAVKDTSTRTGYRIYAYTRNSNFNQQGREVDPLASPCG